MMKIMQNAYTSTNHYELNTVNNNNKTLIVFFIFFLIIFIPFTLSPLIPLQGFLLSELFPPFLFIFAFAKLLKYGNSPIPIKTFLPVFAIIILIYITIIHYIFNPVLGSTVLGGQSGIRQYYLIFLGVCIFFYSLWVGRYFITIGNNFWNKFLQWLIIACLLLGTLRVFSHFLGFDLPFWGGRFAYTAISVDPGRGGRIGGLAEVGTVGLAALLAIYYNKRLDFKFLTLIFIFALFIIISGGRATTVGAITSILFFYFFIQKNFTQITAMLVIVLCLFLTANLFSSVEAQLNRISNLQGGMEELSSHRYAFQNALWDKFLEKPWIGHGIGPRIHFIGPEGGYLSTNITWGHGSYTSILAIFGIFGGIYLFLFLFGSAIQMFIFVKRQLKIISTINDGIIILIFCILNLVILSVRFIAEGNGFNFLIFFCIVGLGIGIMSKMNHALKYSNPPD